MPSYEKDLIDYLASTGKRSPTKALKNPVLLQRCLSGKAPMALVAKVANALREQLYNIVGIELNPSRMDVANHPAVTGLSNYEKGRVMSALDRKEDSVPLYKQALETCTDPETRGLILVNLANDVAAPKEKEQLFRQAIQEGYTEALVHLGMFLEHSGRTEEALKSLLESVQEGVSLGLPVIGRILLETKSGKELESAIAEVIALAQKAGIEDPANAPFDQLDAQTLARSKEGHLPNLLAMGRIARRKNRRMLDLESAAR